MALSKSQFRAAKRKRRCIQDKPIRKLRPHYLSTQEIVDDDRSIQRVSDHPITRPDHASQTQAGPYSSASVILPVSLPFPGDVCCFFRPSCSGPSYRDGYRKNGGQQRINGIERYHLPFVVPDYTAEILLRSASTPQSRTVAGAVLAWNRGGVSTRAGKPDQASACAVENSFFSHNGHHNSRTRFAVPIGARFVFFFLNVFEARTRQLSDACRCFLFEQLSRVRMG